MEGYDYDKLSEAIFRAMASPEALTNRYMKYCLIANFGSDAISNDDRIKIFLKNPHLDNTAGITRKFESGLNGEDFGMHVNDIFKNLENREGMSAFRRVSDDLFSVCLSPDLVKYVEQQCPSHRITFIKFDSPDIMNASINNLLLDMSYEGFMAPRPYLDS